MIAWIRDEPLDPVWKQTCLTAMTDLLARIQAIKPLQPALTAIG